MRSTLLYVRGVLYSKYEEYSTLNTRSKPLCTQGGKVYNSGAPAADSVTDRKSVV